MKIRDYQAAVVDWAVTCFGPDKAKDRRLRGFRFTEEALELAQAVGVTKAEALELLEYVYGREKGEVSQEVGGVATTLATICDSQGVDWQDAALTELKRIWGKAPAIRAKEFSAPANSPLPGAVVTK